MDDFPAASIEEAFGNLGSLDPAVQTLANRYIIEWTNSPNFLSSCLGIIQNSCNLPIRHAASITLAGTIIDQWNSIRSLELHFAIRMYFLQQVLNNPSLPLILKGPFIRIVVIIALYDFPQKWDSFLVDLLFIPPSSPAFLNAMAIIGQFVEEIETCTYLTSDRLLQLEFLLLSFHDLLLPLIQNLINEMSTAPIGLKIMNGIFKWGNISDVLTPSIFNTLLTKCLNNDLTYIDALKCLSFALFDRNDVAPIFEKIAPPLITTLASLQNYESHKIDFIIKFLKKYICLIELYLFAPVIPDSPQKIIELKATIFKTKQGTTSLDLTDIQTKSIPEVRHLYEITLMQQPDELYLDDFWQMWRDLSRRLFMATRGEKDHSASLLLIQPLLPIIFMKLTEYLPSCMEAGRMSNVDAQIFFEYFIRSFPQETMAFISSANLTPALVYLVGLLKQNEITNQYVNLFASRLLEANVPDDFFNAMLFTFSKMANILLPVYFAKLMDICSQSLASNEESIQINAAQAIYVSFTLCPQKFDALKLMGNVGTYARSLTDEALIKIMKLCTFIACKLNMPLDPIISAILYTLQHRPETAIRAMSEMAIAASEKCCLLFESLWEPLFELLNVTDEFTELIFLALTSAIANCRIDDITEPFNYFLEFIKDNTELSSLTFELFAVCRLNRPEFEDYAPILESLVKKSEISAGMFKFLTSFSITSLNVNLILSSIVAGIADTTPDIHKEALNCARNLLLSLAENALLTKLISKVRPVLINSVVQSLMDARHQLGFSRQASFLNEAFRLGELQEDPNYIKEFYASLIACSPEPEQGLFQHVAAHLDHIKENKVDFKESLRDFLLIMRKATPYQIGTFFGDDQQEEETATFGELLEEEEQVRKSIVMSTNALPQIQ